LISSPVEKQERGGRQDPILSIITQARIAGKRRTLVIVKYCNLVLALPSCYLQTCLYRVALTITSSIRTDKVGLLIQFRDNKAIYVTGQASAEVRLKISVTAGS
jgi:hypothetical protein